MPMIPVNYYFQALPCEALNSQLYVSDEFKFLGVNPDCSPRLLPRLLPHRKASRSQLDGQLLSYESHAAELVATVSIKTAIALPILGGIIEIGLSVWRFRKDKQVKMARNFHMVAQKFKKICDALGFLILTGTIIAVIVTQNPKLSLVSIAGILVVFLDKFRLMIQTLAYLVKGRIRIIGCENIYQKQVDLINSAVRSGELYFCSPITYFGMYSTGVRIYEEMVTVLNGAVDSGVDVKILCDVFDLKSMWAVRGLYKTGAELRVREKKEPWHYYMILPRKGTGIQPQTSEVKVDSIDGNEFRPIGAIADKLNKKEVQHLEAQFLEEFDRGIRVTKTQIDNLDHLLLKLKEEVEKRFPVSAQ